MDRARRLLDQLRDERSRRVVLVSHCLLDQNTRYAGGATRPGAVEEVVTGLMAAGYGIHQLPCPERLAWGGVLKPWSLLLHGSRGGPLYPPRRVLLAAFRGWTRIVYRRLARSVVDDVADHRRSGIAVEAFVGIGGSPSCGVTVTMDLAASMEVLAACPLASLTREVVEQGAVVACRRPGAGLFVEELDRELARRGLTLPTLEHDLLDEARGARTAWPPRVGRVLGAPAGSRSRVRRPRRTPRA